MCVGAGHKDVHRRTSLSRSSMNIIYRTRCFNTRVFSGTNPSPRHPTCCSSGRGVRIVPWSASCARLRLPLRTLAREQAAEISNRPFYLDMQLLTTTHVVWWSWAQWPGPRRQLHPHSPKISQTEIFCITASRISFLPQRLFSHSSTNQTLQRSLGSELPPQHLLNPPCRSYPGSTRPGMSPTYTKTALAIHHQ